MGPDGRIAEKKRRTGKNRRRPAFQLGELIYVHVTVPKAERQAHGSHEQAVKEERYFGHHGRTGALLVMTAAGISTVSGARRMPEGWRWSPKGWDDLKRLSMGCSTETKGTSSARFGVRQRRPDP